MCKSVLFRDENMDSLRKKISKKESLLFLAVLLKMLVQSITMTVIPSMLGEDLCDKAFKLLTYSSYLMVIVSFTLDPYFRLKELFLIAALIAVSFVGSYFSGTAVLLTLIYLYGAKNINIAKIIKRLGICYIIIFILIIILSQIGIIEDWDFFKNTDRPRWGVGYSYPTHTSSAFFMAVLLFCYIEERRLTCMHVLVLELLNFWLYRKTNSRAGALLSAMVPLAFYLINKCKKRSLNKSKTFWLLQWAFPVCAITIYMMTYEYNDQGILARINDMLSGRLYYGHYSLNEYGVHMFGQKIHWVGWGGYGHTFTTMTQQYNYVDTSYLKLLLENGVLVWGVIMIGWTLTSIYAYKHNQRTLLTTLSVLAVYCMVEQWLMNIGANPFVLALAYPIYQSNRISRKERLEMIFQDVGFRSL